MEKNKIPTAEEVWNDYHFNYKGQENSLLEAMRVYTKLHVKAALEAAVENGKVKSFPSPRGIYFDINRESILNAYPETLIK